MSPESEGERGRSEPGRSKQIAWWVNAARVMIGVWVATVIASAIAEALDRSSNAWGLLVATVILMTVGSLPGVVVYALLLRGLRVRTRPTAVVYSGVIVLAMLPWTIGAATDIAWNWLLFVIGIPLVAGLGAKLTPGGERSDET